MQNYFTTQKISKLIPNPLSEKGILCTTFSGKVAVLRNINI